MGLVERADALAALHASFTETTAGRGQVVLVNGPFGSGKTELMNAFVDQVGRSADPLVLWATAARAERSIPLGVLSQLFSSACLPASVRAEMADLLDRDDLLTGGEASAAVGAVLLVQVMKRLCAMLLRLAGKQPVLIVIDDAQHADRPSLQCLLYSLRRLSSARLQTVLLRSDETEWTHPECLLELRRLRGFRRVRLAPLSLDGVQELVGERFGPAVAAGAAPACFAVTGGNPLLLRALLDDLADCPAAVASAAGGSAELPAAGCPGGTAFAEAVLSCLRESEPAVRSVAEGIAVLGESADAELVGRLLETDVATVARAVLHLEEAGLLLFGRFRHSAAATAVLDGMSPWERLHAHARAAELLYRSGARATLVARHLVAARQFRQPWMRVVLLDVAQDALAEDEVGFAVECLELVARSPTDADQSLAVALTSFHAESRVNPATAARHLDGLAAALRAGRLAPRDAVAVVRALLWHGRTEEAEAALRDVVAAATDDDAVWSLHGLQVWLQANHVQLARRLPGMPAREEPRPAASSALRRVRRVKAAAGIAVRSEASDDPLLAASRALAAVLTRGPDGDAIRAAGQVLRDTVLDDAGIEAIECALTALVCAEEADSAAEWCDVLLGAAESRQSPTWQARLTALRGEIALRHGDLARAEQLGRSALTLLPARSWGVAVGTPLAVLVAASTAMGDLPAAADLLAQPVPEAMFYTRVGLPYRYARGQYKLQSGRTAAALADFVRCGDHMISWGIDVPGLVPWRAGAAAAHLALDQHEPAAQLLKAQLYGEVRGGRRSRGAALRLLAATRTQRERAQLLADAVAALRDSGDRLELARATADQARAFGAAGDHERAATARQNALRLAKDCQAEPLRTELSGWPGGRRGVSIVGKSEKAGLSEAEQRVAELASTGHSNREIAGKLYITVSTVEQHLTRVYRKLKVRNRADLPDRMAGNAGVEESCRSGTEG